MDARISVFKMRHFEMILWPHRTRSMLRPLLQPLALRRAMTTVTNIMMSEERLRVRAAMVKVVL